MRSGQEYHLPPAQNKLPDQMKTEFADLNEKGAFVNKVITISTKAMTDADNHYNQFMYMNAQSEYLVSLDGFIHLLQITKDDANFQNFLKAKMNYLLDRAERCKKFCDTQMKDK